MLLLQSRALPLLLLLIPLPTQAGVIECIGGWIEALSRRSGTDPRAEARRILGGVKSSLISLIPARPATSYEIMRQTLKKLEELPPPKKDSPRIARLKKSQAQAIHDELERNPVASLRSLKKYDPDLSTGFCFGRAFAAHLIALQKGVDQASIRKIWAVGKFVGKYTQGWRYHVATLVRAEDADGGWWAIDPALGGVLSVTDWASRMKEMSVDHRFAMFETPAQRVFPSYAYRGKELRWRLELEYATEYAEFNGYFIDLLRWFRQESSRLKQLRLSGGELPRLSSAPVPKEELPGISVPRPWSFTDSNGSRIQITRNLRRDETGTSFLAEREGELLRITFLNATPDQGVISRKMLLPDFLTDRGIPTAAFYDYLPEERIQIEPHVLGATPDSLREAQRRGDISHDELERRLATLHQLKARLAEIEQSDEYRQFIGIQGDDAPPRLDTGQRDSHFIYSASGRGWVLTDP